MTSMPLALQEIPPTDVRNLDDSQIRFLHPGYPKPLNLLFRLSRVDPTPNPGIYGVHRLTALTARQIIANNAFATGRLAKDDKGKALLIDDDEILIERDYWFFVEDDGRTQRCAVSNTTFASTYAHIIPREEREWFNKNGMALYGGGTRTADDEHNFLRLKADIHVCFDQRAFVLVPKPAIELNGSASSQYVVYVLDARESEFAALYHNRITGNMASGSRDYVFAHSKKLTALYGSGGSRSASPRKRKVSSPGDTRDNDEWYDEHLGTTESERGRK
ncbi:hypothetical protein QQZ08_006764 [Neonectria magnoliae]|uniref:HNH nuclease domain-containing protein n=1 Tax=Neonectria magnoliae TaxID=2732573 RepID=A0ABR1HZK4_9HYPO